MQERLQRINNRVFIQSIRRGLIMGTPLLMIGSFALVFKFLPIGFYQDFIATFANGFLIQFFTDINQVTFGILSLFSVFSITISYAQIKSYRTDAMVGALFSALGSYAIFIGLFTPEFTFSSLGANGLFTAIVCAMGASWLFYKLSSIERLTTRFYTVGADSDFNYALSIIIPVAIVLVAAFAFNKIIVAIFHVTGFEALFHDMMTLLFNSIKSNTLQALLFIFITGVLWFFGIHGTNVLDSVAKTIFIGNESVGIINKAFLDIFVFLGGSGATISLLIAILLFAKERNTKKLARLSTIPAIFNINELMVFGLPIIYNPYFFIPFMITPLVITGISYLAISTGIVPIPVADNVEWVTPVIFGGYQATGSIKGSLLQIVNIAVGVLIYRFFLVRYERANDRNMRRDLDALIDIVKEAERTGENLVLLNQKGNIGATARILAEDLRFVLRSQSSSLQLYYQPQYNNHEKNVGAEALLRWDHPRFHMIYPPLIIMLAKELQLLDQIERHVFETASGDIVRLKQEGINPGNISVNITAASLQNKSFADYILGLSKRYPEIVDVMDIELTEQMSFLLGDTVKDQMEEIKKTGLMFAIDDFSMGHTSIKYLQSDLFDLVKLDGSIVEDMMENPRSEEIISSIISLSRSIGFRVMAECVETREQLEKLEQLGCYLYQGYFFSRPLPVDSFIARLKEEQGIGEKAV